jgi:pimeloyl-ACP methyl ester carboxylesterase
MNTYSQKVVSFLKRALFRVTIFIFILAIAGTVYQTAATEADKRNFPPPGNLIDVGGFKMHINCKGEESPTVILEAMSAGVSPQWGWIQPAVQKETRVCVYDRAGYGWSESDPEPLTLARTARNLHTLLVNANEEGPYVMAGHSLGGVYVRQFAAEYPDEVVGIVLIDEANPQQWVKYPELFDKTDNFLRILNGIEFATRLGVGHLYFAFGGEMDFSQLPEPQRSQFAAIWASSKYYQTMEMEMCAGRSLWADALNLKGLGDRPLIVLSRGVNLDHEWIEYETDLATLSTNSQFMIVKGANHGELAFNQEYASIVSDAILQVVQSVRSGIKLENPL